MTSLKRNVFTGRPVGTLSSRFTDVRARFDVPVNPARDRYLQGALSEDRVQERSVFSTVYKCDDIGNKDAAGYRASIQWNDWTSRVQIEKLSTILFVRCVMIIALDSGKRFIKKSERGR